LQVLNYDYKHRKLKQLTDSVGVVHYLSWGKKGLEYSTTANTLPKLTDRFGHVWSLDETTLTETNPRTGASRKIEASDKNVAVDYFTDMTLYGDSICLGGMGAFCMIAPCRALEDTANNDRIILVDSFHISSMNHLHTDKVRYAYRFEREKLFSSSDKGEWTILKAGENTITYPDLSSGSYKLMAKCTDCYGRWSEPQQLLTISIPAPWYLFWCSIATFLVIRIGIFIWKRKRRKAQTQDEAAQTADKEATDKETTEPDRTGQSIRQERESKEFMEQLHSIVVRNLDNINYDNDQLAADMGLSRSNLYRKFQRYSDYSSPLEYIRTIRIEEGKRLLRETSHSVTEIAYMTGFSSSQYFAKCFKDMVGLTPKEYRSSH
jgi:AraC-like DNA-binding protein